MPTNTNTRPEFLYDEANAVLAEAVQNGRAVLRLIGTHGQPPVGWNEPNQLCAIPAGGDSVVGLRNATAADLVRFELTSNEDDDDECTASIGASILRDLLDLHHLERVRDITTAMFDDEPDGWVPIGDVGVDSGRLLLCDPCYVDADDLDFSPRPQLYPGVNGVGPVMADGLHLGHVVATGYGDGLYPLEARYVDGRIAAVRITFIDEDD